MPSINFFKYQAAGNDFILMEEEHVVASDVPFLCNRRFGIGADGVLLLQPSLQADYKMRIFNADGTEASMCGNGLACLFTHLGKKTSIETLAGISFGEMRAGKVHLSFPQARILQTEGFGTLVDTGTPHLVVFTDTLEDPLLRCRAKEYRSAHNVNVTLVKIQSAHSLEVCTFEKGVLEETLACGTGAAAAALLFQQTPITIWYPSGTSATLSLVEDKIWMEAQAEMVFYGKISLVKRDLSSNIEGKHKVCLL